MAYNYTDVRIYVYIFYVHHMKICVMQADNV